MGSSNRGTGGYPLRHTASTYTDMPSSVGTRTGARQRLLSRIPRRDSHSSRQSASTAGISSSGSEHAASSSSFSRWSSSWSSPGSPKPARGAFGRVAGSVIVGPGLVSTLSHCDAAPSGMTK